MEMRYLKKYHLGESKEQNTVFCFVLFCFVLFCFVLFCFVLFYFILFYFILFYFILFYSFLSTSLLRKEKKRKEKKRKEKKRKEKKRKEKKRKEKNRHDLLIHLSLPFIFFFTYLFFFSFPFHFSLYLILFFSSILRSISFRQCKLFSILSPTILAFILLGVYRTSVIFVFRLSESAEFFTVAFNTVFGNERFDPSSFHIFTSLGAR
jgi:hypothetical protein